MKECPRCWRCFADSVATCELDESVLTRSFEGPPLLDGKYELQRKLGAGGMGVVYFAQHRGLRRDVAVKLMKPTRRGVEFAARFRTEGAALGALKHPHIVDVTDFGIDSRGDGIPYLVLEYLRGVSLTQRLRDGPIAINDAIPILTAIASAIDFAHEHGVLHRDIKPENIFLVLDSTGRPHVKVLDFGVARIDAGLEIPRSDKRPRTPERLALDAMVATKVPSDEVTHDDPRDLSDSSGTDAPNLSLTAPAADVSTLPNLVGTLPYLAPELFEGEGPSSASDLYAFGVLAYETLVGRRPFFISNIATARDQLQHEPPPAHTENSALEAETSRVLAWGLSHSPSRRPHLAGEFVAALRRAHYQSQCRAWKHTEIPRRRRLSALVAVLLSAAAWVADRERVVSPLEQRLVDAQFHLAPKSEPDPRLIVVAVDDVSLAQDPTVLGERADEFADWLERVFAAGASGVAIDFLLPQRWSTSSRFSRLVLTHADHLALGALSSSNGVVIGPECVTGLTAAALGPERSSALFGFVNLEPDPDHVVRHGRLLFRDVAGAARDSFPTRSIRAAFGEAALARAQGRQSTKAGTAPFRIDSSIDSSRIRVVSWSKVLDTLEREPTVFRDRLVLVGGDLLASGDLHWLAGADTPVAGVLLQAVIADTILGGLRVRDVGLALLLPVITLCGYGTAERILHTAQFRMPAWALTAIVGWGLTAMVAFLAGRFVIPVLLPVMTIAGVAAIAAGLRPLMPPFPEIDE